MKSSLKTIALLLALSYPCVAFAEIVGFSLPLSLGVEGLFGLFCVTLIGLISAADYSRRARLASVRPRVGHRAVSECNRLAA